MHVKCDASQEPAHMLLKPLIFIKGHAIFSRVLANLFPTHLQTCP